MPGDAEVISKADLATFETEVRRLRTQTEPTLYPAYRQLVAASYPTGVDVDQNRSVPGAGFPDLTVMNGDLSLSWVEVKSPDVNIDPLPASDGARFDRYRRVLPHVVLTNGWHWILYEQGKSPVALVLPKQWLTGKQPLSDDEVSLFADFLHRCSLLSPKAATSRDEAVDLLATAARLLRDTILDADPASYPQPLQLAKESFTLLLRTNPADTTPLSNPEFADALAQVAAFGYLLAYMEATGPITPTSAVAALSSVEHKFLLGTLHGLISPDSDLEALLKGPLGAACDMINRAAPRLTKDGGWRNVTYVYEPFFAKYRPEDRFKFGVFYTPEAVARFQVRDIQRILREEFGLSGLLDPAARFLDPACGTGTYLVALAEEAKAEALALGHPHATALKDLFASRAFGFEVSPGPSVVAQVRLEAWLAAESVHLGKRLPIFTVNSLTPPLAGGHSGNTGNIWQDNVTSEQAEGDQVKADTPILVVFGNPPWGARPESAFNVGDHNLVKGWASGAEGAVINLYDLYVAFWRFACDMLLTRPVQEPRGMVSYITNRSWLRGKAYSSMRTWLRAKSVHASIFDLGGDVRAGAKADDQGVFEIMAGSAIASLTFGGQSAAQGTTISYARLRGSRSEKLEQLSDPTAPEQQRIEKDVSGNRFAPVEWGLLSDAPSIAEYFDTSCPGVKTHRDDLVVDVDRDALAQKLADWNELPDEERTIAFWGSKWREAKRHDRDLPARTFVVDEASVAVHRYRPLDDRWIYNQKAMIDQPGHISRLYRETPDLTCLVTLDSRTSEGPVVIASNALPGYDSFRGSYGTHCFPLSLRLPEELLEVDPLASEARAWLASINPAATPEDLASYLLTLGNAPTYVEAFSEALETETVRFPATLDPEVFEECVVVGRRLLAAWRLELAPLGSWVQVAAPGTPLGLATFNEHEIAFANGDRLTGLDTAAAEALVVSSFPVVQRYLEARSQLPLTTELGDAIRKVIAAAVAITGLRSECDALLLRALNGPCTGF